MVEIVVPLVHYGVVQARSLLVGLVFLAGGGPLQNIVHSHFQVFDAIGGGIHGIVAEVFAKCTRIDGIARRLSLAVAVERAGVGLEQCIEVLTLGFGRHRAIPAVAILDGKQVVGADVRSELRHSVAWLSYVVIAGIVHD